MSHVTDWMFERKLGLSTHYYVLEPDELDAAADHFDVEKVAEQAEQAGAGWFLLTLHHQSWLMLSPNQTYGRFLGDSRRAARRDLPLDLHAALERRGIKLMLYVNLRLDPDSRCPAHVLDAMGGWPPSSTLAERVAEVYREYSLRYGRKVAGWWIDGSWIKPYRLAPERETWFAPIAAALRAGNPDTTIAFNPGKGRFYRFTPQNDYIAGENLHFDIIPETRFLQDAQWHIWSFLGGHWGLGGTRYETDFIAKHAVEVVLNGGALTYELGSKGRMVRDSDHAVALTKDVGILDQEQVDQVAAIRKAIDGLDAPAG